MDQFYIPPQYKVVWDDFLKPIDDDFEEPEFIPFQADDDLEYCGFPLAFREELQNKLMTVIRHHVDWEVMEATSKPPYIRTLWRSKSDPQVHLMYYQKGKDYIAIVEDPSLELSLVMCKFFFSWIATPQFISQADYERTDYAHTLPDVPTPDSTLCKLAHDLMLITPILNEKKLAKDDDEIEDKKILDAFDIEPVTDQAFEQLVAKKDEITATPTELPEVNLDDSKISSSSVIGRKQRISTRSGEWASYETELHRVYENIYCRVTLGLIKELAVHASDDVHYSEGDHGEWERDVVFNFAFFQSHFPNRVAFVHGRELWRFDAEAAEGIMALLMKISLQDSSNEASNQEFTIERTDVCDWGDDERSIRISFLRPYSYAVVYNFHGDQFEEMAKFLKIPDSATMIEIFRLAQKKLLKPLVEDAGCFVEYRSYDTFDAEPMAAKRAPRSTLVSVGK
eukprot:TRINITY_DN894_c0_g1_i1.p1 TRINITY_DN894_c0_g1~~TRINITY_DN894_c0_g1_i1.p1  ORF type:complete len:453 (+),score=93.34 TRINITY_DN894_c0_g1_i1:28-1386(+)